MVKYFGNFVKTARKGYTGLLSPGRQILELTYPCPLMIQEYRKGRLYWEKVGYKKETMNPCHA